MTSLTSDDDFVSNSYYFGFAARDTIGPEGVGPVDFTRSPFRRQESAKTENTTWAITVDRGFLKPKVPMLMGVPPRPIIMFDSGSLLFIREDFFDTQTALLRGSLKDECKVSCVFDTGRFDYVFCNLRAAGDETLRMDWSRTSFIMVRFTRYTNGITKKEKGEEVTFSGREVQFADFEDWRQAQLVDLFDFTLPTRLCYTHPVPDIIKPLATVTLFSARLRAAIEAVPNPGITFLDHEVTVLTPP
jgi:hypothetical protein